MGGRRVTIIRREKRPHRLENLACDRRRRIIVEIDHQSAALNLPFAANQLQLTYTVSAILKITEPSGHVWEFGLEEGHTYTIGRAKENDIVLNDRRVSRKHAHIVAQNDEFKLIDGYIEN